jgi:hypothetical protein
MDLLSLVILYGLESKSLTVSALREQTGAPQGEKYCDGSCSWSERVSLGMRVVSGAGFGVS